MMAFMFANALTAAPVIAAEGATVAMTAAEIAAIEAAAAHAAQVAAAQTLAAEQAAALAAQQATAATANTAAATATNAATNQSILNAIGAGSGAPVTAGGIGSIGAAGTGAGTGTGIMGAQTLTPATAAQTLTPAAEVANLSNVPLETLDPAQLEQVNQLATGAENLAQNAPVIEQTAGLNTKGTMLEGTFLDKFNNPASVTDEMMRSGMSTTPPAAPSTVTASKFPLYGSDQIAQQAGAVPPPAESGFMKGISSAMDYMDKNPFKSSIGAYGVAKKTGMLDEKEGEKPESYDGILSKYKMSSDFKGRQADPQEYQYTPKVYNMASGGIASYRRGGDLSSQLDHYEKMSQTKAAPAGRGDPGIVFDTDPDTRSLDPVTAAQVRMAKVNKRANLQIPSMKRPTPMGQLNLIPVTMKKSDESPDTVDAAQGGVIHPKRYADGGVTGSGNLDLHIPLNLGGEGYGGGNGGGATYPFQNNGGFAGNNNAPQDQAQRLAQQAHDQAQRMQPYQASSTPNSNPSLVSATRGLGASQGPFPFIERPEPQDVSSMKGTTFGGNPQQGMSQLMGLLGGQKMAGGGITSLGGYAAGGNPRLLKGPGDGMSDNIPATIAGKQPARLADGEFVIPADVVSHLGNGSTEAGAKKLHKMMNDVRKARTGNPKQGKQINPNKFMPK